MKILPINNLISKTTINTNQVEPLKATCRNNTALTPTPINHSAYGIVFGSKLKIQKVEKIVSTPPCAEQLNQFLEKAKNFKIPKEKFLNWDKINLKVMRNYCSANCIHLRSERDSQTGIYYHALKLINSANGTQEINVASSDQLYNGYKYFHNHNSLANERHEYYKKEEFYNIDYNHTGGYEFESVTINPEASRDLIDDIEGKSFYDVIKVKTADNDSTKIENYSESIYPAKYGYIIELDKIIPQKQYYHDNSTNEDVIIYDNVEYRTSEKISQEAAKNNSGFIGNFKIISK